MKSLLLIFTLVSFTIYKAEMNKENADSVQQPLKAKELVNANGSKVVLASVIDSTKTTAFEKQLKNRS